MRKLLLAAAALVALAAPASAQSFGPAQGQLPNVSNATGTLPAGNGGTGRPTLTAHAVLLGEGTSAVGQAAPSTLGFVLTDNGPSSDPSFQAITIPAQYWSRSGTILSPSTAGDSVQTTGGIGLVGVTPVANQIKWGTGGGSITHILGPTDQALRLRGGSGQSAVLTDGSGSYAVSVNSNGIRLSGTGGTADWNSLGALTVTGTGATDAGGIAAIGSDVVTQNVPVLNLDQTWINAGASFTAIALNVTNTASLSTSKLIDLKVDGTSMFLVNRLGAATVTNITNSGLNASSFVYSDSSKLLVSTSTPANGELLIGTGGAPAKATLSQGATLGVTITNGAGSITLDTTQDLRTSASPQFASVTASGSGVALVGTSTSTTAPSFKCGSEAVATKTVTTSTSLDLSADEWIVNAAGATTQTLPDGTTVNPGIRLTVKNRGAGTATVQGFSTAQKIFTSSAVTTVALATGDCAILTFDNNSGNWQAHLYQSTMASAGGWTYASPSVTLTTSSDHVGIGASPGSADKLNVTGDATYLTVTHTSLGSATVIGEQISGTAMTTSPASSINQHSTLLLTDTTALAANKGPGLAFSHSAESNITRTGNIACVRNGTAYDFLFLLGGSTPTWGEKMRIQGQNGAPIVALTSSGSWAWCNSSTDTSGAPDTQIWRVSGRAGCVGIGSAVNNPDGTIVAATHDASGTLTLSTNGGTTCASCNTSQVWTITKTIGSYNGITTAGQGVAPITAAANITAQTSNATITSYANGAADGTYEISASMNVTAATSISTNLVCTYTDAANTAQTFTFPVYKDGSSTVQTTAIAATGEYSTCVFHIRVKASTTITLKTATGTFTSVTYSASGTIKKTN